MDNTTDSKGGRLPKQREGILERGLPDELILYDRESDRAYLLNRVSAAIWGFCDGRRSHDEIAVQIARHFHAPVEVVNDDVKNTLARLEQDRLVFELSRKTGPHQARY